MIDEINPCPFCGGKAEIKTGNLGHITLQQFAVVECTKCGATGEEVAESLDICATDEAIKKWNNRA